MALTSTEEALVRQLLDQQAAILSLAGNESTITSKLGATKVTLSNLVAASSLADADLLLTRQGTNDKSVRADILAAYMAAELNLSAYAPKANPTFTGDPKAPTAAQFDNDTSLATTAFVQRALGNFAASDSFSQDETLSAAKIGRHLVPDSNAITRVYLPSASAAGFTLASRGEAYHIQNTASQAIAVAPQGSDSIFVSGSSSGAGVALSLPVGAEVTLVRISNTAWRAFGTGALKSSADFGVSLAANGYQKLPSGLIIQWGQSIVNATSTLAVSFPLAFPTAVRSITATPWLTSGTQGVGINTLAASGFNLYNGSGVQLTVTWIAIGY